METIHKPTKEEQLTAKHSLQTLEGLIQELHTDIPEIEIAETEEKIKIPLSALKLLVKILQELSRGNPVSIVPVATEITTQAAAELLGCSRPHIVKLLEEGQIPFIKIGKHRRIKYDDLTRYQKNMKEKQRMLLQQIMETDEESGLYDT